MLYRKIQPYIESYLKSDSNKVLIIDGARQIGKTFIIRYVGQPANQQIFLEEVHHLPVHSCIQALTGKELLMHHIDGELIQPVCQQKLLKIHREHALYFNASDGDRGGLLQGHTEQRPAGDLGKPVVLL